MDRINQGHINASSPLQTHISKQLLKSHLQSAYRLHQFHNNYIWYEKTTYA